MSRDQLFKICTEFFSFSWTPSNNISTHTAQLKRLWNELNNNELEFKGEHRLSKSMLVCKILNILSAAAFENLKTSWMLLAKDEKKTLHELTTKLCMFERNFIKNEEKEKNL